MMSPAVEALLLMFCVMTGICGAGLRLTDRFGANMGESERCVWVSGLGLAAMGYVVLIVGSVGLLFKPVLLGLLVLLLAFGAKRFMQSIRRLSSKGIAAFRSAGLLEKLLVIPVVAALFLSWAGALAPAVGQDELCYHLVQPKNFVQAHAVYAVPFSVNALWPYLTHMLFTLGLLLQGAETAKLFHWVFYALTGAGVGHFARRFAGGRAGWIAAVTYLLTPAAFTQAAFAYIDHALAFYVFMSFYAVCAWRKTRGQGWAWMAGASLGFAASVKLIGLFAVFPIAVIVIRAWFDRRDLKAWSGSVLRMAAAAFAAGSVWYLRSWILRGNPVYPFYPSAFSGNGFEDPTYTGVHGGGAGIMAFIMTPWNAAFHPDLFGGEVMGPLLLACAPLALLWARKGISRSVAAGLFAYAVFWFMVDPNIRFFFAAFAWMAVLTGVAVDGWMRQCGHGWKAVLGVAFAALIFLQSGFAFHHFGDEAVLLAGGNRQQYLGVNERSYQVAEEVNRVTGADAWILSAGEVRGYYFASKFTLAGDMERMVLPADRPREAGAYARYLKTTGFTHVLLAERGDEDPVITDTERIVRDRAVSRSYFKDELVVRRSGMTYTLYRIL